MGGASATRREQERGGRGGPMAPAPTGRRRGARGRGGGRGVGWRETAEGAAALN